MYEPEASREQSPRSEIAEAWNQETHQFVIRIFRARLFVMLLFVAGLLLFLALEPVPWRLIWIGVTALITAVFSIYEYRRIQHTPPSLITIQLNLALMFILQTSMVIVTGGIESPILPVYLPFGIVVGLSLRRFSRVLPVVMIPVLCVASLAGGVQLGWLPRTMPAFLGLEPGFADKPFYLWTKAGLIIFLLIVTSAIGVLVRVSYERVVRQFSEQRGQMLDTVASRNREILSVASTVAHELKNPLTSIQGLAQLMARTVPAGKDSERLEVMRREIARMASVLDEFRNFSRPLSGLALTRIQLPRLIHDVVVLNEGRAESKGVRLIYEQGQDLELECDAQKIRQALLNLVQNALEATPSGGKVEVELRPESEQVLILVTDSGPGIAPEIVDRLFTPGATTKERGTGIGLVVTRSIAEQHGGKAALENLPGGGCRASIVLPLRAPVVSEEQV